MPFMERIQSAFILKTHLYHPNEAHIIEHPYIQFKHAIKTGNIALLEALIYEGFDVDYHESTAIPALMLSILENQSSVTQVLLMHGANPNTQDVNKQTALHIAVKLKKYETIHLLLRYGADIYLKDLTNSSALDLSKSVGDTIAERTLDNTPPITIEESNLFSAASDGNLHTLTLAIQHVDDIFATNGSQQNLLHLAVYSGNVKLIAYLLNKQLDIDATDEFGNTPLIIAAQHTNRYEVLEYLISRHATLDHKNGSGSSALSLALYYGYATNVTLLLEKGASIYIHDGIHTPLTLVHNAIAKYPQSAKVFRDIETKLLIRGTTVDIPGKHLNWTPLIHTATRVPDEENLKHLNLLISLGADINYKDMNKRTALMLASSMGRKEAVDILLNNYAEADFIDTFGWSALMLSVYYNQYDVAIALLEYGANPNLTSDKGLSALSIAQQHNRQRIIMVLLDFGAINHEKEDDNKE